MKGWPKSHLNTYIHTEHVRDFWQGNYHTYGHTQSVLAGDLPYKLPFTVCMYAALANSKLVGTSLCTCW